MKKLLAVLLAIICAFSAVSVSASALDLSGILGGFMGDLGFEQEEDEADILSYGVHYEMSSYENVTLIYKPSPSITFNAPTEMVITNDYPIAVDHNWICWKNQSTGEYYYPGDTIYVEGKVTLVAVWEEKTDNYPSFFRSVIAGLQGFVKMIEKALGLYDAISSPELLEPSTEESTTAAA